MSGAIIRIALRYGAAYLVARGFLTADDASTIATDPDIQMIIGAGIGVAAEAWYFVAKKFGWST